jgi:hypothetical protein
MIQHSNGGVLLTKSLEEIFNMQLKQNTSNSSGSKKHKTLEEIFNPPKQTAKLVDTGKNLRSLNDLTSILIFLCPKQVL